MKTVTRLAALAVFTVALLPAFASAQTVLTVREIINVPQANLDQLAALGGNVTTTDVTNLLVYTRANQQVQFTGVALSDPYNSGLASPVAGGTSPTRIHVFVRDTSSVAMGNAGMTTQVVGDPNILSAMRPGRVYTIIGTMQSFSGVPQVTPTAVQDEGPYQGFGFPDSIMDPVLVVPSDINTAVTTGGEPRTTVNWTRFNEFNGQYVRFQSVLVTATAGSGVTGARINFQWSAGGSGPLVNSDDISLRWRNDRAGTTSYPNPPYNTRAANDLVVPPPVGAIINVQGFANLRGFDFITNQFVPSNRLFGISPFEDDDVEILSSPPIIGEVNFPAAVPGNSPVAISAAVTPDPARTISSVVVNYAFQPSGQTGQATMTDNGAGIYSGSIPAGPDGNFASFDVVATDNQGGVSHRTGVYRVLHAGIDAISDVQQTANNGAGPSPFAGYTFTSGMNLDAVVQAVFTSGSIRFAILQDDPALGEWSGIWAVVEGSDTIAQGDRILITAADIVEFSGLTQLDDITFSVQSSGAPYAFKVLPTGILNGSDPAVQEQHEGMMLQFNNVTITDVNADGADDVAGFGEWQFSSDGTEANELRGDDLSDDIPADYNIMNFTIGQQREFIRGVLRFANSQYKLVPVVLGDIGQVIVANEPVAPAVGRTGIQYTYPNPTTGAARVRYNVAEAGAVRLAVYDALGREVAVLAEGELAASTYEADLDGAGLAPGLYVVRLQAGGAVHTARLTVAR